MPMTLPDFDQGKSIGDRPGNTFADSLRSIIGSSDESISSFGIRLTLEFAREGLARHGIDTTSREAFHGSLFVQIETENIEISPDRFHGFILMTISDCSIYQNFFVIILFYKVFRELEDIFRTDFVS